MENNFDINNKEDFEDIVNKTISGKMSFTNNRESYEPLYRGQTKDSYLLRPSLARFVDSTEELYTLEHKIFSEFKKLVNENSNLKKMFQFSEFENKFEFESDWRWLEQMQHFGLPTRLLDWSIKPEIALFFAVNNHQFEVGQFWVYKSPLNWPSDDIFESNPFTTDIDFITNSSFYAEEGWEDKIAELRRGAQHGKFTFQNGERSLIPMEDQLHLKEKLINYSINPQSKKELLDYLSNKNINKLLINVDSHKDIENLVNSIKEKYGL